MGRSAKVTIQDLAPFLVRFHTAYVLTLKPACKTLTQETLSEIYLLLEMNSAVSPKWFYIFSKLVKNVTGGDLVRSSDKNISNEMSPKSGLLSDF